MRKPVAFTDAFFSLSNATPFQGTAGDDSQAEQAIIEFIRAHVTIDSEGMFVIDSQVAGTDRQLLRSIFEPLNNDLAGVGTHLPQTVQDRASTVPGLAAPLASWCGDVPKWVYQACTWYAILSVEPSRSSDCSSTR